MLIFPIAAKAKHSRSNRFHRTAPRPIATIGDRCGRALRQPLTAVVGELRLRSPFHKKVPADGVTPYDFELLEQRLGSRPGGRGPGRWYHSRQYWVVCAQCRRDHRSHDRYHGHARRGAVAQAAPLAALAPPPVAPSPLAQASLASLAPLVAGGISRAAGCSDRCWGNSGKVLSAPPRSGADSFLRRAWHPRDMAGRHRDAGQGRGGSRYGLSRLSSTTAASY
jgi:hypothetical protein